MSSARSGMLTRAVLLVAAVSLVFLLVVVTATKKQEQGVEKRATQTPTTLADVIKLLVIDIQKSIALESKRAIISRGRDGREKADPQGFEGEPGRPGVGVRGPAGPKSGGIEYVRWGKATCPYNATLVYKGRIGDERYNHKGGGTNYVCLPETPKYERYRPGYQSAGYMYGTEYQVDSFNPFTEGNLHDHEVPCAVCYGATRGAKLMIPATYECPAGWTRKHHGYLMTQYYGYAKSEFICVDEALEALPGTQSNREGDLLFPVEGRCGSLPCCLPCAVCTK